MNEVRIGIIGTGSMGAVHAESILTGKVPRARLTAVCDLEANLAPFAPARPFTSSAELIRSGLVDAVLIATPHLSHVPIGCDALRRGMHVLVEKPIAVHKAACLRLLSAHRNPRQVFGVMFNQRTDGRYLKLRELVQSGDLGKVHRITWIITNWFRSEAYYRCSAWRATWAGEGGGILLNQCPHNLDLLQWIFGMPMAVRAFCRIGRFHDIEVEDDVSAFLEFPGGATGTFIASTGEAPGTNRLEIAADNGRVVLEAGRLVWDRTEVPVSTYSRETSERWEGPPFTTEEIPTSGLGGQHVAILKNFVAAILDGEPLIAPAAEGIHSVELANAMLYSSHVGRTISLPLKPRTYSAFFRQRIATSKPRSDVVKIEGRRDLMSSFGKT
jgi:predicted dehydrogenase